MIVWIGDTTGDVPLETLTVDAANAWKVGRKGKDDGAILFIFCKDHKARIEVGYGLESALTDADAHRIITDDIIPHMKANDPDGAVSSGVSAMLTTITPAYKLSTLPSPSPEPASRRWAPGIAIAVVAIICLGFAFFIFFIIMQVVGSDSVRVSRAARGFDAGQDRHEAFLVLGQRRISGRRCVVGV